MSWYVVFFLTQTPSPWNNCGIAFSARNAKAAFVIMETVEDAKWIVENVNGTLAFAAGVWVKHGIPTDPQKTGVFLYQISSYILILCFRLGILGCDEKKSATWPHFDYLMAWSIHIIPIYIYTNNLGHLSMSNSAAVFLCLFLDLSISLRFCIQSLSLAVKYPQKSCRKTGEPIGFAFCPIGLVFFPWVCSESSIPVKVQFEWVRR
jgi:hypothetical protein